MPLNPDGFGQELIKKPSLDLHAVAGRDSRPAQAEGEMRRRRKGVYVSAWCREEEKGMGGGDSSRAGTRGL